MIVMLIVITSCQVSLNWNNGPVRAQITIMAMASENVIGRPVIREVAFAKRMKFDVVLRFAALSPNPF